MMLGRAYQNLVVLDKKTKLSPDSPSLLWLATRTICTPKILECRDQNDWES